MNKIRWVWVQFEDGSMKGYNRSAYQKVMQLHLEELLKDDNHLKVMEDKENGRDETVRN